MSAVVAEPTVYTERQPIFLICWHKNSSLPLLPFRAAAAWSSIWGGERCCSLACLGFEWRREHSEFTVGCSGGGGMNVLPSGTTGLTFVCVLRRICQHKPLPPASMEWHLHWAMLWPTLLPWMWVWKQTCIFMYMCLRVCPNHADKCPCTIIINYCFASVIFSFFLFGNPSYLKQYPSIYVVGSPFQTHSFKNVYRS